jgi:hypothetical protein
MTRVFLPQIVMICQRCGNDLPENSSICPRCGSATGSARQSAQPPTSYGQFPRHDVGAHPSDQRDGPHFISSPNAGTPPPPPQQAGPLPVRGTPLYYQAQAGYTPFTHNPSSALKRDTALVAEFILSLFGLFGVGWLIAGSTVTGIILIICSVFIYWPLMIGGVILTRGIGLLCLGPLAIGAIILNTLLLAMVLRRKAARTAAAPPPPGRNYPPF